MPLDPVSPIRILLGTVFGLFLLILIAGVFVRQPNFGSVSFPDGPRADPSRLREHVEYLCTHAFSRQLENPDALDRAADYIHQALARSGAEVSEQPYDAFGKRFRNIVGRFGPDSGALIVLGAHYDVSGRIAGADDNASGVAGLLEAARLLGERKTDAPIMLVAFSTEEPPFFGGPEMGSAHHAEALRTSGAEVKAMISLEMIGYFSARQPYSSLPLYLMFPRTGDFVAIAGRWEDRGLAKGLKRCFRGASRVPAVSYSGPVGIGADLSDNRNYWACGFPAVMVTDTAFLRNPNYHTPGDVPSTLDYQRMAGVVDGVLSGVLHLTGTPKGAGPGS